jgi:hypothetical protein
LANTIFSHVSCIHARVVSIRMKMINIFYRQYKRETLKTIPPTYNRDDIVSFGDPEPKRNCYNFCAIIFKDSWRSSVTSANSMCGHGYDSNYESYHIKPGCVPPEGLVILLNQEDVDEMVICTLWQLRWDEWRYKFYRQSWTSCIMFFFKWEQTSKLKDRYWDTNMKNIPKHNQIRSGTQDGHQWFTKYYLAVFRWWHMITGKNFHSAKTRYYKLL